MSNYSPRILSGSTNGKQIKVGATATPGTLIHTAVTGASDIDEIYLYAVNSSASAVKLTIEWGGVVDPDDLIEFTVPAEDGYSLIIPGLRLQNDLIVRAFAATTDVILIDGFVNRYTA